MLKQALDFKNESDDLYKILEHLPESDLNTKTLFKEWSFNTIIRHLHVWNYAANIALLNVSEWEKFSNKLNDSFSNGKSLSDFEKEFSSNLKGKKLLENWKSLYSEITEKFKLEDPKKRVKWVGPDMSVISSISARHMETWAHGQAIFDSLGIKRKNEDRILNIVIIGNNTFNWSYKVNKLDIPKQIPYLKLTSPSGEIWKFNDKQNTSYIEGMAEEFCQVVTQVRNIKDVNLTVKGAIAEEWMSLAQCFAGKAQTPPKPATRRINLSR